MSHKELFAAVIGGLLAHGEHNRKWDVGGTRRQPTPNELAGLALTLTEAAANVSTKPHKPRVKKNVSSPAKRTHRT